MMRPEAASDDAAARAVGVVDRGPARGRGAALVRAAGRPGLRRLAERSVVVGGLRRRASASSSRTASGGWRPVLAGARGLRRGRPAARSSASGAAPCCCWRAASGLVLFVAQALGIGLRGWTADWLNAAVRRTGGAPGRHRRGGALVLIALAVAAVDRAGAARRLRRRRLRRRRGRPRSRRRSCCSSPGRSCASCCRPSRTATAPSCRRCWSSGWRPRRSGACAASPAAAAAAWPGTRCSWRCCGAGTTVLGLAFALIVDAHRPSPTRRRCAC